MFVSTRGKRIIAISDTPSPGFVKLPDSLSRIHPKDLINHYEITDDQMVPIVRPPKRIAIIAPYNINCGIATYTNYLVQEFLKTDIEMRVFSNEAIPISPDPSYVERNWTTENYSQLVPAIRKYNPDIVYIQHEYGYFHDLKKWQSLMSRLSKDLRVVVTMHTVLDHRVSHAEASIDYRTRYLSEIACPEIIVHTPKAIDCLRDRGYGGIIHVIPHGCHSPCQMPYLDPGRYSMHTRNLIFQYGFGGQYKGWKHAIDAVKKAKDEVPDIFYLGIYNLPRSSGSVLLEFEDLIEYIDQQEMNDHVAIIKGYQTEEMLKNAIRSAKAGLFLYSAPPNWASWGASGAIQLPMSMGLPLILGEYPAFDEYRGLLTIAVDAKNAATELVKICQDPIYHDSLVQKSLQVAESRCWLKVARWYLEIPHDMDSRAL